MTFLNLIAEFFNPATLAGIIILTVSVITDIRWKIGIGAVLVILGLIFGSGVK